MNRERGPSGGDGYDRIFSMDIVGAVLDRLSPNRTVHWLDMCSRLTLLPSADGARTYGPGEAVFVVHPTIGDVDPGGRRAACTAR